MSYRNDLHAALTAVGISGGLRGRIMAEIDDHLEADPEAQLGEPTALARQFADELGTARARWAGFAAFGALALSGVLFGVCFLTARGPAFGGIPSDVAWPGRVANWIGVLAPQLAFAAGTLAVLRAFHRRREAVIPEAESQMLRRRAVAGVIAGIASMVSLLVLAIELHNHTPGWWRTLCEVSAGVGLVALLSTVPALLAARRLPTLAPGSAGDLFDDIGHWLPGVLRAGPWRVAWALAAVIFALMAVTGFMADDGPDGIVRGVFDGLVCLLGFATLGRYLGLWTPGADRAPGGTHGSVA